MNSSGESSKVSKLRLAILILAAGEGSRLGGYPKALLKKDGSSLLKHLIDSTQGFNPVETLVVTGFYANEIEAEIQAIEKNAQSPIAWVRNANPASGQSSSVRLGIESLMSNYEVVLIALCDQPEIGALEIESLLEQFHGRSAKQEIVLPVFNGQRGNPVLFSRGVIERILETPGMVCRTYMDQHPELVKTFATDNEAYILDADTRDDIQKLGLS